MSDLPCYSNEELKSALDKVFDKYPNVRIPIPMLTTLVASILQVRDHQIREPLRSYLLRQRDLGFLSIQRGSSGGVMRSKDYLTRLGVTISEGKEIAISNLPSYSDEELHAALNDYLTRLGVTIPPAVASTTTTTPAVINDHICPHCKNDKVSKTERSCWKCGNLL